MRRGAGDRAEIRSVGRALDLLEMMQRKAPAGIRVRDAADRLGVDPATASRLLSTLIAHGYASRLPNRRYMLGARSLWLATAWVDRLIQIAAPAMGRVADGCGGTVYLMQLVGSEAVTLARLTGDRRTQTDDMGPGYPLWAAPAAARCSAACPRSPAHAAAARTVPGAHPAYQDTLGRAQRRARQRAPRRYPRRRKARSIRASPATPRPCRAATATKPWRMAISFDRRRPESDRRAMRQALRREWRQLAWQI